MKKLHHTLTAALLSLCASCAMLASPVSAASQATEEDVYAALEEIGMPPGFIQVTRNHANAPGAVRDEDGMEISGIYKTYDAWIQTIREEGQDGIWDAYAIFPVYRRRNSKPGMLKRKPIRMRRNIPLLSSRRSPLPR